MLNHPLYRDKCTAGDICYICLLHVRSSCIFCSVLPYILAAVRCVCHYSISAGLQLEDTKVGQCK